MQRTSVPLAALLLLLTGCGGGGGGSPAAQVPAEAAPALLGGAVVKGPVAGAELCAYELASTGKGRRLACTRTQSDGSYALALDHAGPVVLEASGGSYVDEATGATRALPVPLASVVSVQRGAAVQGGVTPLTHFAYAQALPQGLSVGSFAAAAATVRSAFGLPELDLVAAAPVLSASGGDDAYGAALRTVARAMANGATIEGLAAAIHRGEAQAGLRQAAWCSAGAEGHLADWNVLVDVPLDSGAQPSGALTAVVEQPDPAWRAGLASGSTGCTASGDADGVTLACPAGIVYDLLDIRAGAAAAQPFTGPEMPGRLRLAGQRVRVSGVRLSFAANYELRVATGGGVVEMASSPPAGGTLSLEVGRSLVGTTVGSACAVGPDGAAAGTSLAPKPIPLALSPPAFPRGNATLVITGSSSPGGSLLLWGNPGPGASGVPAGEGMLTAGGHLVLAGHNLAIDGGVMFTASSVVTTAEAVVLGSSAGSP